MEQEDGKAGRFEVCSSAVIGACIEVHRHLGPVVFSNKAGDETTFQVTATRVSQYRSVLSISSMWRA
jgi:hypothetical protein